MGYSNNTLSCSELNREHAGEGFRSLRQVLTPLSACKAKNVVFRENLTFDLTRSNVDLGLKTICAIARSRRDASTGLFREALRPSGADRQGEGGGGRTNRCENCPDRTRTWKIFSADKCSRHACFNCVFSGEACLGYATTKTLVPRFPNHLGIGFWWGVIAFWLNSSAFVTGCVGEEVKWALAIGPPSWPCAPVAAREAEGAARCLRRHDPQLSRSSESESTGP